MIYEIMLTVQAYSPWDKIDADYRRTHPIPITSRGNLCSSHPHGIAGDSVAYPVGTTIYVAGYSVSNDGDLVDDTGGNIRREKKEPRLKHIEIRFATHEEAVKWGTKTMKVIVRTP